MNQYLAPLKHLTNYIQQSQVHMSHKHREREDRKSGERKGGDRESGDREGGEERGLGSRIPSPTTKEMKQTCLFGD